MEKRQKYESMLPDNSEEMVAEFIKNPLLGDIMRQSSAVLLDSIDSNYFTKKVTEQEKGLIKMVVDNFKDKDPVMEVRLYKMQHILYAILKTLEDAKVTERVKQKTTEEQIKIQAKKIYDDYKHKRGTLK